jgi:ergothioneine biosynthesis protein EgtB
MATPVIDVPTASLMADGAALGAHYRAVRRATEALCAPLDVEDYVIQSMPDASPAKWHLAHTSWFFETFVLAAHVPGYRPFHPQFAVLFNSYYNAAGPRWPRPRRGLLSRPTVAEIYRYRARVDERMTALFEAPGGDLLRRVANVVVLGLHHEQQHQELLLTDLKHALAPNPLRPVYREVVSPAGVAPPSGWHTFSAGVMSIGHEGAGFAFDNESPRHRVFLEDYQLASRPVTNGEFLAFLADGGYERPELWLSDGWTTRQAQEWTAPLYWEPAGNAWMAMTLAGSRPVDPNEPVCHVSYYEADAFARWAGARLPTEAEWEVAAAELPVTGHFVEGGFHHPAAPAAADDRGSLFKLYGDVWQWTASAYAAYPGYAPAPGEIGDGNGALSQSLSPKQPLGFYGLSEYNAKFFINNMVLRGASCATPRSHSRPTYRNFFPPHARWQFTGLRLARDLAPDS